MRTSTTKSSDNGASRPSITVRPVEKIRRAYLSAGRGFSRNVRSYLTAAALQNTGYGIIGTVLAIQVTSRGFGEAVVGDMEGAAALAGAVVCLLLPPLVASTGYRRLMIFAGAALALARFGQAYAPTAAAVVLFGLLFGAGDGSMQALSTAFLSENTSHGGRTRVFTVDWVTRVSASVVGALIGGLVPAVLEPLIGEAPAYRLTIVLAAGIMGASAFFAARIEDHRRSSEHVFAAWLGSLKAFRSWGRVVRLLVPEMLIALGAGFVMPFAALFLKHQVGASVAEVGVIQAVSSVAMALAAFGTPFVARRFGLAGAVAFSEIASLPFLAAIPLSTSLPATALLFWVRSALMNMSWPIYNQLSMEGLPAQDKPLVAGWVRFGWSVAWFGGSIIGGRMNEISYTTPYYYTLALYLLGAIATLLLLRTITVSKEPAV